MSVQGLRFSGDRVQLFFLSDLLQPLHHLALFLCRCQSLARWVVPESQAPYHQQHSLPVMKLGGHPPSCWLSWEMIHLRVMVLQGSRKSCGVGWMRFEAVEVLAERV